MKSNDEKLIQYLAGEMSSSEAEAFEELLNNTPELRKQKVKYEQLLGGIKETVNIEPGSNYFTNLIPAFRARLDSGRKISSVLKWSLSLSSAVAVIILALVIFLPQKTADMNELIGDMDQQEITELVDDMRIDVTPADTHAIKNIDDIYIEELSDTEYILESDLVTDTDLLNSLSEDETELVYSEMINKDLLKE
jgi:hypothetical protein